MTESDSLLAGETRQRFGRTKEEEPLFEVSPTAAAAGEDDDDLQSENSLAHPYPWPVFLIIGNEFCERFSFYGMKAVLFKYFNEYLRFGNDKATAMVHIFVMFAYFFPLFGGALSDSYLGKFKTILYLSLIYSLGNIILAVTAIPGITGVPPHWWGAALGLGLLAFGTGGIKPCVSSFGGDQFHPSQFRQLQGFFSAFYFSINLGSVLSTFITPIIRSSSCFGEDVCYAWAFGLPAILMIVATVIFFSGAKWYKVVPPTGNVLPRVAGVIYTGLVDRHPNRSHWLDSAIDQYGVKTVNETKQLLRVLFMFLPLPLFWALYDQQSSRWIEQAQRMDRHIGSWEIQADQIQVINALLILIMIPSFEKVIYPLVEKCGFRFASLTRMTCGMLFTGVAFLMAAFVQLYVEKSVLKEVKTGSVTEIVCVDNCVSIVWQFPQYVVLTAGEILFSITGLEFAYSQAPKSMKSVCQASWLLTVAVGNLLVAVVAASSAFEKGSTEFMFFASLIFIAALIFGLMSRSFVMRDQSVREIEVDVDELDEQQNIA